MGVVFTCIINQLARVHVNVHAIIIMTAEALRDASKNYRTNR